MSSRHILLSEPIDALNFSISGSVAPVKRPPQSFFSDVGAADAEAAAAEGFIWARGGRGEERCCWYLLLFWFLLDCWCLICEKKRARRRERKRGGSERESRREREEEREKEQERTR
jgi:hypothetical protein